MDPSALTGLLVFLGMLVMIMIGFPVFMSMLIAAFAGFYLLGGSIMAIAQFTSAPFNMAASYTYAVLPFFMIVGILAGETGIARDAYQAVKRFVINRRGGLLDATILANTVFGACSGLPTAGNVVFTKIATPELDAEGYEHYNSLALITASGTLSSLIPPSLAIVNFCILNELSITRSLMCGTAAGLLTTVLLILLSKFLIKIRPEYAPMPTKVQIPLKQKLAGLKLLLPILGLFVIIIGGSFAGLFSATVGGAIGTVAVLVYALATRLPLKKIFGGVWEGVCLYGRVFPMLMAGTLFGRFVALSGLPGYFTDLIIRLNMPPLVIFTIVIAFYIFCGCVMDLMSIIIITTPIIFPMLTAIGFDPYALCIVLVFMICCAGLTPPVGIGVYIVANVDGCDPMNIFKKVWPYVACFTVICFIIAFVPQLVTWLPDLFT